MKHILLLGAGLVARPLVQYLLKQNSYKLTIATRTVKKAEKLIDKHPRGSAIQLNIENKEKLKELIEKADIVISLLPWIHHLTVAKLCLEFNKNLITTSYVKPEMQALEPELKKRKLLFLNEIGVDPGIDHMAAMRIINHVKNEGGEIESFYSYCGGLPALKNNNNPLGYKFSWSPVGVMLAAKNDGRYLSNGKVIEIPGDKLFEHYWLVDVPGAGTFEAYINRDALPYIKLYNIPSVKSMYRGTLRNIGHCESWRNFKKLGLLDQQSSHDFSNYTPLQVIAKQINGNENCIIQNIASYLKIPEYSVTIKKLQWLGILSNQKLPLDKASVFDMFAYILQEKLIYQENEVDLLVQHHEFIAKYSDKKEKITSTLVDEGIADGDSSMARTVSLPAAIATRLILEEKINLSGVHIPVLPEIYEPILTELETMNIKLHERRLIFN